MIFVLWAIAILSMVAMGFSKDTKVSALLKSIRAERVKDLYAARGASLYALVKLSGVDDESTTDTSGEQQTTQEGGLITSGDQPTSGTAPTSGVDSYQGEESKGNGKDQNIKWVPGKHPYSVQIGNIDCDVHLTNENGKININGIDEKNREILITFLTNKGVDILDADVITDSILDWIDTDDLSHINGAEDGYYGSLPLPYKSKDDLLSSIEEMALVKGVTPEIFGKIRDEITVYGDKKIIININNTTKDVLSSIPGLSDDLVDELFLYVEENGTIETGEELRQLFWDMGIIGGSFEEIRPFLTVDQSDFVTISAVASGLSKTEKQSNKSSKHRAYDYKLVVGKTDKGYKIYAAYPE